MFSRIAYGLSALLLGVSALAGIQFSSAEWTGSSRTPMGISAARDWTPPMIAVEDPGFVISGTVTITATASDAMTSVASVTLEYAESGTGSWTTLCTVTAAPYSCSWDTWWLEDAAYDLRATAVDADGNSATSDIVTTEVANVRSVVIDPVPSPSRGTVTLTARVVNYGWWSTSITFEGAVAGTGSWFDLPGCTGDGPEASCSFNTALAPDGVYDLRAVALVKNWLYTDVQRNIVVDNTAPSVSLNVPSGPLSGAVNLTATASDALAGVDSVRFEYRLGSGAWTTCGVATSGPYACSLATSGLADGTYSFRAVATDAAGNSTATGAVSRLVDNTDPSVSLTVPTGPLNGTVTLSATASDPGSGIDGVQFQYRLQGAGSWSSCGTDSSAPYTCDLNANPLLNGTYEFRAVATDNAGRTATTATQTAVVQSVGISLSALPAAIRATTTVTATWQGSASASVLFEYKTSAGSTWTTITGCGAVTAAQTANCSWNPSGLTDGSYDVRVRSSYQGTTYSHTRSVIVDKTVPSSVVVSVPAAPLNGTVQLSATAADALSGIASVLFEYKLTSGSTWATCGTATASPYTCSVDTATLNDASYDFRATGSDAAGNTKVSSVVARTVNSAVSSVSITSPASGSSVLGTTTVTTNATSTKAIANVVIQYKTGAGAWTTACTATASPYSCSWNTSTLAYGSYQLQAVLTQANGYTVTSAAVPVAVERFRGYSIDATPGGTLGKGDNGDVFVFTYTSTVNLSSVKSGWNGSTTSITAYLRDRGVSGAPDSSRDWLAFASGVNLGTVSFPTNVNYANNNKSVTFGNATMTASTVTVGGRAATQITVSLGDATVDANQLRENTGVGHMLWAPSSAVTDGTGTACLSTGVDEVGTLDGDL